MTRVVRTLAEKYGYTPEYVCQMTMGQIYLLINDESDSQTGVSCRSRSEFDAIVAEMNRDQQA